MKTLYYLIISLLAYTLVSCSHDGLVDLTPEDGFNTEFAFNQVKLIESISFDTTSTDTGWYAIKPIQNIKISSPFVPKKTYITTDTFAFEWHDYEPVLDTIQKIANGFDIQNSTPASNYKFMPPLLYSNKKDYLIPMFNKKGQRYWIQVFRDQKSFFQTYYTARGIWIIGETRPIKGDVS